MSLAAEPEALFLGPAVKVGGRLQEEERGLLQAAAL